MGYICKTNFLPLNIEIKNYARSRIRACNGRDTLRIAVNANRLNVSSERRNNSSLAYGHSFILVYCQLRGNKHR